MPTKAEEVGLLLVHGIGEQKQFDHLRETAAEIASFVAETPTVVRLSVTDDCDKTDPRITIEATLREGKAERQVILRLHEVWWADLGIKNGLIEQIKFWFWGLGQWAAEAVFTGKRLSNSAQMMVLPRFSSHSSPDKRPSISHRWATHAALLAAAMLAFLTFFTWSAAKRLIAFLSKSLPDSSLIYLFIGDVMIYQQAGGPGQGTTEDPDLPVRATIRRRMVRGMTSMAQRPYDRWLILAHSLGCVPAFNALQEMELTLPNYLTEAEWNALAARLKTQQPFVSDGAEPITYSMMPRRPPWLSKTDGISRVALFERFAGLVTYGCPLDKFAALWPRIVPLNKQTSVFQPACEWINLHEPTDPVAAKLDAFAPPQRDKAEPPSDLQPLAPQNFATRALWVFLLSHLYYFNPQRRRHKSIAAAVTGALISGERLSESAAKAKLSSFESWSRTAIAAVQAVILFAVLLIAAGYLLLLIRDALSCKESICGLLHGWTIVDILRSAAIVFVADFAIVFVLGIVRMISDAFRPSQGQRDEDKKRAAANL